MSGLPARLLLSIWPTLADAADVMLFMTAPLDMERTASRLKEVVACSGSLLPGFYGATVDGAIKLFQRSGGDTRGAIATRRLDADCMRTGLTFPASFRIPALFRIHAPLAALP